MEEEKKQENAEKKEKTEKTNIAGQGLKKDEKNKKEESKVKGKVTIETKKTNRTPIIVAVVVIVVLILAILLYVVLANTPRSTVDGMFRALKNGEYEKVNEYVNYQELISSSEVLDSESLDQETMNLFFDKLSWKVTDVVQEDNNANVTVEVTNKNFKTIIGNYMQNALRIAFSGEEITDAEMENYLLQELRNEDVEMTTTTQTISLTKQDGKWVINTTDTNLINILLPGLSEAVNSLS